MKENSPKIINLESAKITNESNTKEKTVIEYVTNKLRPYFGKTQLEIYEDITNEPYIKTIPKNFSKMISDKLIGKDKELPEKDEI